MTGEQLVAGLALAADLIEVCWDAWTQAQRQEAMWHYDQMRLICELLVPGFKELIESAGCTRH